MNFINLITMENSPTQIQYMNNNNRIEEVVGKIVVILEMAAL